MGGVRFADIRNAVVAAAVLVSAASVEAATLPGFVLTASTDRVQYYSRGAARPDVAKIEGFVTHLESQLGTTNAPASRYYLYATEQELAAGTGNSAAGVTFPAQHEVHSTLAFHRHELVHLVASRLGNPGVFFQEGLAVALGDEGRWRGKAVNALAKKHAVKGSMAALVGGFSTLDPEVAYPMAGSFVAWLIQTKGLDHVKLFFNLSANGSAAAFDEAFGMSLDGAGAAWQATLRG